MQQCLAVAVAWCGQAIRCHTFLKGDSRQAALIHAKLPPSPPPPRATTRHRQRHPTHPHTPSGTPHLVTRELCHKVPVLEIQQLLRMLPGAIHLLRVAYAAEPAVGGGRGGGCSTAAAIAGGARVSTTDAAAVARWHVVLLLLLLLLLPLVCLPPVHIVCEGPGVTWPSSGMVPVDKHTSPWMDTDGLAHIPCNAGAGESIVGPNCGRLAPNPTLHV
jgi:hypothetical protein